MLITLCAIAIAILMELFTPTALTFHPLYLIALMLTGGTLIFLGTIFLNTLILNPLNQLEQKLIPNLMNLLRHNFPLRLGRFLLFLFPLLSFVCVAILLAVDVPYQKWLFLGWIVTFGLSLDVLRDSWLRLVNFLNPTYLVEHFSQEAKIAIQNDKDQTLWQSLDGLSEICLRSVEKSKLALSAQTLQTFPPIIHAFFASSKSIAHFNADQTVEKETGRDEASYTIFYLLQRLELINDKALHNRLETICRQMIMTMGKLIVYGAQYDLSMVSFPTHFLTKFGLKAQQHHFDEVAVLTTSTLLEISKTIIQDIDLTYADLQDPFRAIINGLAAIARNTFKKDKQTNIKVLTQPLIDLKAFFETEKMAKHRDTPVIIQEINGVLEEFQVLEQMMHSIPTISDLTEMPPAELP